jgi:PEP-CTERM motif-containing protein
MKKLTLTLTVVVAATTPLFAQGGPCGTTPEPSTAILMGGGLAAMILVARKIRARKK